MVDAKELRIDNWVFHNYMDYEMTVTTPMQIQKTHFSGDWFKDCEPIPITPEILEKCGFVNKHGIFWQLQMGESYVKGTQVFSYSFMSERLQYSICHGGENEEYVYLENVELGGFPKFLHQLQNLIFALTGQELDIKL